MEYAECTLGRPVWVAQGSYGWRAGIITKTRILLCAYPGGGDAPVIYIAYRDAKTGEAPRAGVKQGKRHPLFLRPRDPFLRGKDKPKPPSKGG